MQLQYIKGEENVVADFLSRQPDDDDERIMQEISHIAISDLLKNQQDDQSLIGIEKHSLKLHRTKEGVLVDKSKTNLRIVLPEQLRYNEFERLHNLCHQGANATIRLISDRYVWPKMRSEIRNWCKHCLKCQANKVSRHTKAPVGTLPSLGKFKVVHLDIVGPLPIIKGKKFLLTMIDRETSWTEVVPLREITTSSIVTAMINDWISRFGTPEIVITDNGRQFISGEFNAFCNTFGIDHRQTTSYHPQCNGKIERFHRTLKNALRTRAENAEREWLNDIPITMMAIRNMASEETELSPSQVVLGTTVRLPGDIVLPSCSDQQTMISTEFRNNWLRSHGLKQIFIPKDMKECKSVWIKSENRRPLQPIYEGPYTITKRYNDGKVLQIMKKGKLENVSVDRTRPAFILKKPPD